MGKKCDKKTHEKPHVNPNKCNNCSILACSSMYVINILKSTDNSFNTMIQNAIFSLQFQI